MRLHSAFTELIYSSEPYIDAPMEIRLPWYEVAHRVRMEKRELKNEQDRMLTERQQELEAFTTAQAQAETATHEKEQAAQLSEHRRAEAERASAALAASEKARSEHAEAMANTVAKLVTR